MHKVLVVGPKIVSPSHMSITLSENGFDVVGETENWLAVKEGYQGAGVDLVVLDMDFLSLNQKDFVFCLNSLSKVHKLLIISDCTAQRCLIQCLQIGAVGFIRKTDYPKALYGTAQAILNGYTIFPSDTFNSVRRKYESPQRPNLEILTVRELNVFNLLVKGWKNKDIASSLSISAKTISTHKTRILKKFKITSVLALVELASNAENFKLD